MALHDANSSKKQSKMNINKELAGRTSIYILLNLALGIFVVHNLICMYFNKKTHRIDATELNTLNYLNR